MRARRLPTTLLPLLAACAFALALPRPAAAQCNPGDILIGEDDDNYICKEKAAYENTPAHDRQLQYCVRNLRVASTQKAISDLNLSLDAERFEEFANIGAEQKANLESQAFNALLDQGLDAVGIAAKGAASLNPYNVNRAADMLTQKGLGHPQIIAALRKIARTKDKPAMAAAYGELVDVINAAREGWSTGSDMAADPANAKLRLLVGALKVMQGNPQLGLAITGAEMSESIVYLVYLTGEVNELAAASDARLSRLTTLSTRLKTDVIARKQAKKSWQTLTGYTVAWPYCPD